MDYLAHGIWSYIFFHRIKKPFYAVLFGLMPDTLSWGIYLFYNIFNGQMQRGPPVVNNIPQWVFTLYGLTHSLIIFGVVLLLIYLIFRKIPLYVYAWPIAIAMDALTHTREFLPTPILWPFQWKFPGISWGNPVFMIINYSLVFGFLIYIVGYKIKKEEIKVSKKNRALKIFNIANSITLARLLLTPLFIAKLFNNELFFALGLYLVMIFSDGLDGFFARRLKQETYFGKYFDAIADSILLFSAFLIFLLQNKINAVLFLLLIAPRIITTSTTLTISLIRKKKIHFITKLRKAAALLSYLLVVFLMFDLYKTQIIVIALLISYTAVISDFVKLYTGKIKV